jgi:hypothetical protein
VVNGWIEEARREARIQVTRRHLLLVSQGRFPGAIPTEVLDLIDKQEREDTLEEWYQAAVSAPSAEQFLAVVRR